MARKSMGLLDAIVWIRTTGARLQGVRASNIYLDRSAGVLLIKLQGIDALLVLEGGRRVHLSWRISTPGEYRPHPLVVLARKHLRGKRIESISLLGGDRIVEIRFPGEYRIVAELVPRGVIALLGPDGRIMASDRALQARDREVRPGVDYRPPPSRPSILWEICTGNPPAPEALLECIGRGRDLVRGLVRGCGVQGEAAEEALYRSGLDAEASPSSLGGAEARSIVDTLLEVCRESLEGRGYLIVRGNAPVEAVPFRPRRVGEDEYTSFSSFDEALDSLFSSPRRGEDGHGETADPELARLEESLRRAEERAEEYKREAERLRRLADIVARAYDRMATLLDKASRGERATSGRVTVEPRGETLLVVLGDVKLFVPRGSGPEKIVVELYRLAGEMDAKAERALSVREEVWKRLDELRLRAAARSIASRASKRRRYWFERYHWTATRSGFLAVGGRDAGQNEAVVKRYLGPRDIFLHANIHGAPAVVLRTGGLEPGEGDLFDAAVLSAAYSRAWKAGAGSVEVYWARADQVSFSPPSGEYLARGGIMVYGRKNYLPRPVPVRLALGVALNEEGLPLVFQGSEEAVRPRVLAYVVLAPGDMGKEEAAEEVRRRLASVLARSEAPLVYAVRVQEIMPRIPGRARVIRVSRGEGRGISMSKLAGEP